VTAAVLDPPRYRISSTLQRINHSDTTVGDAPVRSLRVAHLVRGRHTLCGRFADAIEWLDDTGESVRCTDCASIPDGHYTHLDMQALARISYRQLDHWVRKGFLRPDVDNVGSGRRRTFPPGELAVARVMGALAAAGMTPRAAERVARGGQLAPGITVSIALDPTTTPTGDPA